jgi:hydrogenase maturation protease
LLTAAEGFLTEKRKSKGDLPGQETDKKRVLVIGYGNPARGDDGIGPAVIGRLENLAIDGVTADSDYQLTVEDAADAAAHDVVIFVDASVDAKEPYEFDTVRPKRTESFSSHSVSPEQVLGLAEELFQVKPKGFMLAIRGYSFEMFDESLTEAAARNMDKAFGFLRSVIHDFRDKTGGKQVKDGKFVILCIDDDEDVLLSLRMVLEKNNYEMIEARSGEEGLSLYKKASPDFIIVDLMMESIDAGKTFAKELLILDNKAPVYMLSSTGDTLVQNFDFSELGLDGVFQKPIDTKQLLSTLKIKLK